MIGSDERSWSSLYNVVIPAIVVWIEASWVSAWLGALANIAPHFRADVPLLALATPALLAAVLSGCSARLTWPSWCRTLATAPLVVIATALSAGVIGMLYLHGSFSAISAHPWTVTGKTPSAEAALAWFAATLAFARGTWLGWQELSFTHAVGAVIFSTLGFVVFFILGATNHATASFHPQIGAAAILLLLAFPGAIAVIALVNERELELNSLRHRRSRPNLGWLGAVLVPMVVLAVVGVLLALGIGPLAPFVGRFIRAIALWVAAVIRDFALWLGHFFHAAKRVPAHLVGPSGITSHSGKLVIHVPLWIWFAAVVIGVLVATVVLFFILRTLLHMRLHRDRQRRRLAVHPEEQRESIFSWRHLLGQVLGLIYGLFGRLKGGDGTGITRNASVVGAQPSANSVRHNYRRVLLAARTAGHGREISETPFELERRLSLVTGASAQVALREMTEVYERTRYGEESSSDKQVEQATRDAEILVTALLNTLEQD